MGDTVTVVTTGQRGLTGATGPQGPQGPQGPAGGGGSWGSIAGTLSAQTDLQAELDAKATVADLNMKAPLASPTFTGTPVAPTAAPGTNTTQLASTAFVKAAVDAIPPGGVAIGDAVSGGTANAVLFVDASGNLGQDATNFKWNNGLTLIAPSVTNTPLTVKGTSGQSAPLQEWYNGSGVKTGDIQEHGQLALYAASSQINIQNTGGGQGGMIGRDTGSGGLAISANIGNLLFQAGGSANTIKLISNNGIIEAYDNSGGAGILLTEMTAPAAPAANKGVLFLQDNGSGKTQFCVRFPTGAVQVIATEP